MGYPTWTSQNQKEKKFSPIRQLADYPTAMNFYFLILWDFISVGEKSLIFGQEMNFLETNHSITQLPKLPNLPNYLIP